MKTEVIPVEKLRVELTAKWLMYLEELKDAVNLDRQISELKSKLNRLEKAGLTQSLNYRELHNQLSNLTDRSLEANTVMLINKVYPQSMIIPWNIFYDLLDYFGLEVGEIKSYKSFIPNDIVDEMTEVNENMTLSAEKIFNTGFYKIDSVNIVLGEGVTLTSEMKHEIIKRFRFPFRLEDYLLENYFKEKGIGIHSLFTEIKYISKTRPEEFLIIAPEDELDQTCEINIKTFKQYRFEEEQKRRVKDPMVMKPCAYGAVIFSKWIEPGSLKELNDWKI